MPGLSSFQEIEQACLTAFTWNKCSAKKKSKTKGLRPKLALFFCTGRKDGRTGLSSCQNHSLICVSPFVLDGLQAPNENALPTPNLAVAASLPPWQWAFNRALLQPFPSFPNPLLQRKSPCFIFIIFQMKWQGSFPKGKLTAQSYKLAGSACSWVAAKTLWRLQQELQCLWKAQPVLPDTLAQLHSVGYCAEARLVQVLPSCRPGIQPRQLNASLYTCIQLNAYSQ